LKKNLAKGETLEWEGKVFSGPCEVRGMVVDWVPHHGPYVRVAFDEEGKVFSKSTVNYQGDPTPSFLRKARKWSLGY
jgi:hypothetical protein